MALDCARHCGKDGSLWPTARTSIETACRFGGWLITENPTIQPLGQGYHRSMINVQITIADRGYAEQVAQLLADGEHQVHIVDSPAQAMDGVILIDEPHLHALGLDPKDAERYIVLEPNNPSNTADLWRAGVRYVAFTSDPVAVTKMAVLAAELRLMTTRRGGLAWGTLH